MSDLKPGWILELIPRQPPPAVQGLVLVGFIMSIDRPYFRLLVGEGQSHLFRIDEFQELAIRESDRYVFELGRVVAPLECTK